MIFCCKIVTEIEEVIEEVEAVKDFTPGIVK